MNITAAASASSELLAAAMPPATDAPPAPAPTRSTTGASRSADSWRCRDDGDEGFARTLREEIGGGSSAADADRAARHTAPEGPRSVARKPATAAVDDDGGDAPPTGNGLPPWLAALPVTMPIPATACAGGAAAASDAAATSAAATTLAPTAGTAAAVTGTTVATATPVATEPTGTTIATATIDPAFDAIDVAPSPPLNESAALAAATDDGASPAAAGAVERATALAATVAQDAPESVPTAAPAAVQAAVATPVGGTPSARELARALAAARGPAAAATQARTDESARAATLPRAFPAAAEAVRSALREARGEPPPTPFVLDDAADATTSSAAGAGVAFVPSDLAAAPADPPVATIAPLAAAPATAVVATPDPLPGDAAAQSLPLAVGAPDWDRQLADKVQVLVDQGLTNAQLKLSPAHLGPLEIRISLQDDRANVWFGTHSHATREALEAAAPRLRDALGSQGFANVGVSVDLQQQTSRQSAAQGGARQEPEFSFAAGENAARPEATRAAPRAAERSRLDAFA